MVSNSTHPTRYRKWVVAAVIALAVAAAVLAGCKDQDADLGQGSIPAPVATAVN